MQNCLLSKPAEDGLTGVAKSKRLVRRN